MTEALQDEVCIESVTHSCCEGGKGPTPWSDRGRIKTEVTLGQECCGLKDIHIAVIDHQKAQAAEIESVQAERGAVYGPPEVNMAAIAKCWSGLLMNYYKRTDLPDLTPAMVALMESAGTKACRLAASPTHPDSQLDYDSYGNIHHRLAK